MRNYKREPIASIQSTFFVFGLSRNIYRLLAYQLFSLFNNKYLFGANIYMNIFRCEYIQMRINAEYIQILPLCKTIEKMEKGNNKKSNYLFPSFLPSFLPFCPFSRTSALRLMFYLWNCQSCKGGHDFFLNAQIVSIRKNKTHKFFMAHEKQSCKVNWKQSLYQTHLTDNWKSIYGRRFQEIWEKCLTFSFVI